MERRGNRHGMGFNPEQRQYAKDRAGMGLKTGELAGGKCEFPGEECWNKPEPIVSHLEAVFIAFLDHKDPRAIRDEKLNSILQCEAHNARLDALQAFQVQSLKGERLIYERRIGESSRRRNRRAKPFSQSRHAKRRR